MNVLLNTIEYPLLNGIPAPFEDVKKRFQCIDQIVIKHSKYKSIFDKISECHQFSIGSNRPECLLIYGYPGVGKTRLLEGYEELFPRKMLEEYTYIPVLYLKVPAGASPKSLATHILYTLKDPNYERGTETQQTKRIIKLVKLCKVELLIIDEFQHLIDSETKNVLNKAADWIKVLVEEIKIPVILCGMPDSEKIFIQNEQLDRRFVIREHLTPFKYGTIDEQKEFRSFLNSVDKQMPFAKRSYLAEVRISEKMYYASMGTPFYIMTILKHATVEAAKHGQDFLTEDYLSLGYKRLQRSTRPFAINPFEVENFDLIQMIENEQKNIQINKLKIKK